MIVADASALLDALARLDERGIAASERLAAENEIHSAHLVKAEALSGLRGLEARGALSASRASQTAEDIANLQLTTYPIDALVPRIWALRNNLSIYDAWYIALAEALEAPLVTTDGRLERIPGVRCDIEVVSQRRS